MLFGLTDCKDKHSSLFKYIPNDNLKTITKSEKPDVPSNLGQAEMP